MENHKFKARLGYTPRTCRSAWGVLWGVGNESGDRTLSSTGVVESKPSYHHNRSKQELGMPLIIPVNFSSSCLSCVSWSSKHSYGKRVQVISQQMTITWQGKSKSESSGTLNLRLPNTTFPSTANKNALSEVTQLIEKGGKTRYQLSRLKILVYF